MPKPQTLTAPTVSELRESPTEDLHDESPPLPSAGKSPRPSRETRSRFGPPHRTCKTQALGCVDESAAVAGACVETEAAFL